jgi:transcriptional regulator with XRE-family HTH domain
MTDAEIEKAYLMWCVKVDFGKLDSKRTDWIATTRKMRQLSLEQVGQRVNKSRKTIHKFEKAETEGTLSLKIMKDLAIALDCEFIYSFKPKNQKTASENIWNEVIGEALKHVWLKKCDPRKRSRALVSVVNKILNTHNFRQKKNWSYRKFEPEKTQTVLNK